MNKCVMVMAGGTGGHIFPALAVADYLKSQGVEIFWLGTERGMESRIVPDAGFPIEWVNIRGLRGNGVLGWLLAPFKIARAILDISKIVRRRKPDAVIGMGGFVTGPGGVVAWLTGRPLLIHEQNAIAGMTNRWLSRIAKKVMQAFPGALGEKAEVTGNPLRSNVVESVAPEQRFNQRKGSLRILVLGGSLGAKAINDIMPEVITRLKEKMDIDVWHQTGEKTYESTIEIYQAAGQSGNVVPFIDDMAEAYEWADLVVCRAGALTVSEICAIGVPAIFVPFPHAVDDHQTVNASFLVEAGAASLIQQNDLTVDSLTNEIEVCMSQERSGLLEMAKKARALAKPKATETVANACLEVLGVR